MAPSSAITAAALRGSSRRILSLTTCRLSILVGSAVPFIPPSRLQPVPLSAAVRALHNNPANPAGVLPIYGTGPPPKPPQPLEDEPEAEGNTAASQRKDRNQAEDDYDPVEAARKERLARRKRQAEVLRYAGDPKAALKEKKVGMAKRFWKSVDVKEVNGELEIHLDTRPLRHPTTKSIIRLPLTKPNLAHAIAVEWDTLTSAQQATKQHLIPLTSLTCRALDIAAEDAAYQQPEHTSPPYPTTPLRTAIAEMLLRYLDTDSILIFSPPRSSIDPTLPSLHDQQRAAYSSIVGSLTSPYEKGGLWPGLTIEPVDDGTSIMPRSHPAETREAVRSWMTHALSPFELAGLERAALAGKSLLVGARLVAEWSEDGGGRPNFGAPGSAAGVGEAHETFGVEEAAKAVSLEVAYQTQNWGEVEDTHDVEREDLRRQLGSVVLLVSGTGAAAGSKRFQV
ncbi:hypothetical protein VTJ04DRAFT_2614 [Mycothermus thermophilus]|uniref:uncharacterized protein n=1 Tax=Humicola insolens TaxID=85995 RepID=UPI0037424FC7